MLSLPILNLLQDCCDPALTAESLEEIEIALGRRLPREYADFLLQFNGGYFLAMSIPTFQIPPNLSQEDFSRVSLESRATESKNMALCTMRRCLATD
jgi:hypothetical protein